MFTFTQPNQSINKFDRTFGPNVFERWTSGLLPTALIVISSTALALALVAPQWDPRADARTLTWTEVENDTEGQGPGRARMPRMGSDLFVSFVFVDAALCVLFGQKHET